MLRFPWFLYAAVEVVPLCCGCFGSLGVLINIYPYLHLHISEKINLNPLSSWKKDKGPVWYQAYNDAKHSRVLNFSKANLVNVLNAVAAVFTLLYARYDIAALNQHQENNSWEIDDDGFIYKESSYPLQIVG